MADYTQIVSNTPKRTRIRLSRKRRNREEMARLARALEEFPSVSRVDTNLQTGTIVVHHEKESLKDIESKLNDLGVILMAATGLEMPGKSLPDAISDLGSRLGFSTGSILNLKVLVPLGFGALALLQLARRGFQIEGAPWYILAYFAFESFARFNSPDEKCAPEKTGSEL
jgi:hypothetical protein